MVVAGSCSIMTQKQNEYAVKHGFFPLKLDVEQMLDTGSLEKKESQRIIDDAIRALNKNKNVLLYSTVSDEIMNDLHKKAEEQGFSSQELGVKISETLAEMSQSILQNAFVNKLIIAGGETAGYLCRALKLAALEVGNQIDPGVPFCFSMGKYKLALALKSGNFGSEDFYIKAVETLQKYTA